MDPSVKWIHLYAQDSWQLTPRFKIDAPSVQYNPKHDERNRMAAVDLSSQREVRHRSDGSRTN